MEKYINVLIIKTFVLKMRTLLKSAYSKIFEVFYRNNNTPVHLRGISRLIGLNEGPLSRHLNKLIQDDVLIAETEGNLKKFKIKKTEISKIYTLFDISAYQEIPYIRKNAINFYLEQLNEKPIFVILFGSTANKTFNKNSDIDIVSVFNKKTSTSNAIKYVESQTGLRISEFQLTYPNFIKELKLQEDNVIQSAITTGFPIYNHLYYYQVLNNE